MQSTKDAEGTELKVGDPVFFKADVEQYGTVAEIDGEKVVLEGHFTGGYIGGQTRTTMRASDVYYDGPAR